LWLLFTFFSGFTLHAIRDCDRLFDRFSGVYLGLDVLAERGFAGRLDQRHGYFFFAGVGFMFVVVRMIAFCRTAGLLGLAGSLIGLIGGAPLVVRNTAGARPPLGFVVPSRAKIFSAARERAAAAAAASKPRSAFDARRPELSVGRVEIPSRGIERLELVGFLDGIYLPFLAGLAVLALSLKALAVGAPLAPGLRIFSPDPAAIRSFLA
jgi:hypothetical protein